MTRQNDDRLNSGAILWGFAALWAWAILGLLWHALREALTW